MENATKALLIAGSILIAILLIAMGVRVFNSTKGTTDSVQTTMNATEIATFNSKFTQYAGEQGRSNVYSLINLIVASNASSPRDRQIVLQIADGPMGTATTIDPKYSSTYTSIVSKYNKLHVYVNKGSNGLVNNIVIRGMS